MLCSVKKKKKKKNVTEKYTVKPIDSLILTSLYLSLCFRSGWWLNFWGGFIAGVQIYKEKHRS